MLIAGSNAMAAPERADGLVVGDSGIQETGLDALVAEANAISALGVIDRVVRPGASEEIAFATVAFDTRTA